MCANKIEKKKDTVSQGETRDYDNSIKGLRFVVETTVTIVDGSHRRQERDLKDSLFIPVTM